MAKYTVEYACEHGSREMQLYGKTSERERKIAWMQGNISCPACTKAQRVARDNASPRKATIHISGVPMLISAALTGQIEPNKVMLRERGWAWSDDAVGALGLLETRPEWRFVRHWQYQDEPSVRAALADIEAVLAEIGWAPELPSEFDVAMALEAIRQSEAAAAAKAAAREQAIAANPRPARPAWYAAHVPAGEAIRCNRKIYGTREQSIYVNNVKVPVTAAQVAEIEAYWQQLDQYNKAKVG